MAAPTPGSQCLLEPGRNAARPIAYTGHGRAWKTPTREHVDSVLDPVGAVVLAAPERIGGDPEARFRFFRRLLAVAQEEAVRRRLS